MDGFPRGTVTFLFTDIEGSTRLLQDLGGEKYAHALTEHRRLLREAFLAHDGVEVETQGDAFLVAFAQASSAVAAARAGQAALAAGPLRVRMGVHTGAPLRVDDGYVGLDVHRAARIAAAGHGGQILVSQATRRLSESDDLRDLGEHRLKDLAAPERLYQVGEAEFPPLRSLNRTNLPVMATALVGREVELREIRELLRSSRLLTLTGAGGSGKTRLAVHAAAEAIADFPDGVWFVSLASVREPHLVPPTVTAALGEDGDVADVLAGKRLLLVLDNLEQLLPGAAPAVAELLAAPDVRLLATSRERLHLGAEHEYAVQTLPLDDAVALFTERARQLNPSFEPDQHVAEVAERLDGLPLALELAAARVKVLTPERIVARLGRSLDVLAAGATDAPERHRTLRTTIEWSHALLDQDEQRVFSALAVFIGGCALEAAEDVCETDLDTLASLLDKSLVRAGDGRFRMLETIRDFASERLSERLDVERVARRHAEHFATFMTDAAAEFEGSHQAETFAAVQREQWNVRAALSWAIAHDEATLAFRLAAPIGRYSFLRGQFADRSLLEDALALEGGDESARAAVLLRAGELSAYAGDRERAFEALEECIELQRRLDDRRGLAIGLNMLGVIYAKGAGDDLARARDVLSERLSLSRELGDEVGVASALSNLGVLEALLDAPDRARPLLEEALEIAERYGHDYGRAVTTTSLGTTLVDLGEVELASRRLREALVLFRDLGVEARALEALGSIARLAVMAGDVVRAGHLLGAVEVARSDHGEAPDAGSRTSWTYARAADLGGERFDQALAEGRALSIDAAVDEALALAAEREPAQFDSSV